MPEPKPGQPPLLPIADPFMRLLARILDGALVFICSLVAGLTVTAVLLVINGGDLDNAPLWQMFFLPGALVSAGFWYEWLLVRSLGQSAGKRLLGMRIVNAADGGRVSSGRAALRALCYSPGLYYLVNWIPVLAQLNVLWMVWDRPGWQCLHDKVARTVVIDEKRLRELYPPQPVFAPYAPQPSHPPQYPWPPHVG
ncbi:RDD family protein [Thermobifida halotolerans]|uniref:RDD family protein n=1 Tax=Thermobifida halotolerans TaxID=483545 RepID=A0AA97LV59_9ACTN|nr:RDD family protein [Thermobifida halotolerans]UOE18672.1 RDD family protein [Thermobifida halotolerans]